MKKKVNVKYLSIVFVSLFTLCLSSCSVSTSNNQMIEVIDTVGDKIKVPKNPKKVACISRCTYDLLLGYGLFDNVYGAYKGTLDNPWVNEIYPNSSKVKSLAYNPSAEDLLKDGVDLIFAPTKFIAESYRNVGLNAITISLYGTPTFDNFIYKYSDIITTIWDSSIAKQKATKWKTDVEHAINEISSRIKASNIIKAKKLFYVRGDKDRGINYTDTVGSFTEYGYRLLGLDDYSNSLDSDKTMPSDEEIIKFNPDYIVCGGIYQNKNINLIKFDKKYKNLSAVQNQKIFNIPIGLTAFEQLSIATPIFFYDQANKIYPDLFKYDIQSLLSESLKYYFNYDITSEKINWMLKGLGPTGNNLY
ncbi:ABC transporter substrate-binding protein [Mycoplasmoides alvi]|uniref:ABC transporter substrate-binding protein n=1 Tax=Mycoplasmoides alvi TaxID=78580 RepID=UPI00051C4DC8|nr:ABC transporter substrate-binding protein [Mycoplasmoides alvi]